MTYAAVIVTYNRKEELAKNIEALQRQNRIPDRCYIIDNNSSDGTKEYLTEKGFHMLEWLKYVYLPENIGGAGGFYTGSKLAYEAGFDFVCLMDDDGRPYDENTFEILMKNAENLYHKGKKLIFLNALVYGEKGVLSFGLVGDYKRDAIKYAKKGLIKGKVNPFNGTLISKELFKKIGFPNKDLFIKGDERDFLMRAIKAKSFVATVVKSNYYHPILPSRTLKILGKEIKIVCEPVWKAYYRSRNYTYIYLREREYKKLWEITLSQLIGLFYLKSEKIKTLKAIFIGIHDGFCGNLGKKA